MKIALSLMLLFLASSGAYGQAAQVTRIDIVDYGIYTADNLAAQSVPGAASGTVTPIANIRLAASTRGVPAQQGVRFGFRYLIVGTPAGTIVPLHLVTIIPPPGVRNPSTQQLKTRGEFDWTARIGAQSARLYDLTHEWEVVPGVWTLQIFHQGRKLADESFTVVRQ